MQNVSQTLKEIDIFAIMLIRKASALRNKWQRVLNTEHVHFTTLVHKLHIHTSSPYLHPLAQKAVYKLVSFHFPSFVAVQVAA